MLTLALLFTLAVVMWDALDSVVYYNNNETMPAALGWTISALYLGATFVIGLVTPMRVGAVGPVLAYPVATLLWPLISGGATIILPTSPGGLGQCFTRWRRPPSSGWPPISAGDWAGRWKRGHRPTNNLAMLRGLGCERRGLP